MDSFLIANSNYNVNASLLCVQVSKDSKIFNSFDRLEKAIRNKNNVGWEIAVDEAKTSLALKRLF